MRKEIILRMRPDSEKYRSKAMKVAATVSGVESITVTGAARNLLLVIGDDVDPNKLTKKLKKEVGEVEIVELRTLTNGSVLAGNKEMTQSPYQWHPTPERSLYVGGHGGMYPAASPVGSTAYRTDARALDHRQAAYSGASGEYYHSPAAAPGGASIYSRMVARDHPANYSPMIERHDLYPVRYSNKVARRRHGTKHNCCSIQ